MGKGGTYTIVERVGLCFFFFLILLKVHGDVWETEHGMLFGGRGSQFFGKEKHIHQHTIAQ